MRKLNLYYVISIISLSFMMFVLLRTLQYRGWFEDHRARTPAELLHHSLPGSYILKQTDHTDEILTVYPLKNENEEGWLAVVRNSLPVLEIRLSDFEDEEVLVELFHQDTLGNRERLEGCELLISDASGKKSASTLGEFCGLMLDAQVYIDMHAELENGTITLQLESKLFDDQTLVRREQYLLERQETDDE